MNAEIRSLIAPKYWSSSSLPEKTEFKERLEEVSKAIVNQILHHPSSQLKSTDNHNLLNQQAEALRFLFNLDSSNIQYLNKVSRHHVPVEMALAIEDLN